MIGESAPPRTLGIVGLGLIGQSIARAAKRAWPSVHVTGVDPGIGGQSAMPAVDQIGDLADLTRCDVVVLAAPVTENMQVLTRLGAAACHAIVTDVGSTKVAMQSAAAASPALRFIGGHPMAGNETGIASASLFDGRRWYVTSTAGTPEEDINSVESFARALGGRPERVDAATHDRLMAAVSHTPQIVASVLMEAIGNRVGRDGLSYAGNGLIDTTRLASIAGAWLPSVFETNRAEIGAVLDDVIRRLVEARQGLDTPVPLGETLRQARAWRSVLLERQAHAPHE